ncbi:MAG: DNA polymerase III subunit delta' [Chloroflexota bacterium]
MAWQLLGQERVVDFLRRSLRDGRLSHAYLVVGPPHVGKMTLALGLAQAVNCEGEGPPCGQCRSCLRIASGKHADLRVVSVTAVEATSRGRPRMEVSIDDIRELQRLASTPPYEGRHKVFIVDGAERLSTEAANCLLKTLEEPPPRVLLLLLTAREQALLPTVVSRCQRLELKPLPAASSRELLVRHYGVEVGKADLLARLSGGCLGWALSALKDGELLEQRRQDLATLVGVTAMGYEERFALAAGWLRHLEQSREALEQLLDLWACWWRDLLLVKAGCPAAITNIDCESDLAMHAAVLTTAEVRDALVGVQEAKEQLAVNASPRLVLEMLMLNMPKKAVGQAAHSASGNRVGRR